MAQFVEFVTGTWLDGLDDETQREAEALCGVMTQGVLDALLALVMFERAIATRDFSSEAWERESQRERSREEELATENPRHFTSPDYGEWRLRISEQAKRDIVRANWAAGKLPRGLEHRLPFLHAETFVNSLAQAGRALRRLTNSNLNGGETEVLAACDDYETALFNVKGVRDSVEHAEDRMRRRNRRGQKMALAPVTNSAVHAPAGVLIGGMLNGRMFGWTVDDGTYQEVELSDETIEAARAAVQRALDAMPWRKHGYPRHAPY